MLVVPLLAGGWYSVNIDAKTTAAMSAAYAVEAATEMMNDASVQKMLDHYTNAEVATAGVFASKWLDRKALQNVGLFGNAEENYYYRRIYALVSAQIMPKLVEVAALMIKHPDQALYWGPYLFRVCEQTKQLCMTFETVVANGKVSFQDIAFLAINDNLKGLFDLAKLGEVDWKAVWEHLAEFGSGLTKEDLEEDLEGLMTAGGAIASAGGGLLDSLWVNSSKVGNVFHSKPGEIIQLYHNFKDMYETLSNPANIKDMVMAQILTTGDEGVANLFTLDGYNITSYISDFLQEMQGRYYTQRWYIYLRDSGREQEVYEETLDTQYESEQAMQAKFNAKLAELNDNEDGRVYHIGKDSKHYYSAADANKMKGCASVSFTMECHDHATLGEGNFSWKENGDQRYALDENSKRYAMETTLSGGYNTSEFDAGISEWGGKVTSLTAQIHSLEETNDDLLAQISRASVEDAAELRRQYNANKSEIARLQSQLSYAKSQLQQYQNAKQTLVDDYANELDGTYRIPAVMHEIETAYAIQWTDAGSWMGWSFIRHGNVPHITGEVEFRADLSKERGERRFLGIRIHRAILAVHWTLTANYSSSQIVDMMQLDPGLSDEEKANQVNERMRQIMSDHPWCTVEAHYAYSNPREVEDDDEAIHLLWVSDRLAIARDVDYQLSKIYAQLILCEKFLRNKESMENRLKQMLGIAVLDGADRIRIGGRSFRRWRRAAAAAARGESMADALAEGGADDEG